jgi:hypothetical protein
MSRRRKKPADPRQNPSTHDDSAPEIPTENVGPMRFAMVVYRDKPGWRLVECEIPQEIVDRYTVKRHEPDALQMVSAKVEGALMHMTAGRR